MELDEDDQSIIRVQKFVDGGIQNPGAARKSGLIQPGDEVIAVNGKTVISYEQTLELLQEQTTTREMTFRRPLNQLRTKSTPNTTGRIGRTIQITPNPAMVSLRAVETDVRPRRITLENKEIDDLLSPAHVKALSPRNQLDFDANKQAALKKIVTTVAGVVSSKNYWIGSVLGSNIESSSIEDKNKELRSTIEQKYELLRELSQAKVALHQQKELFEQQSYNAREERQRMEEELMISRREKQMAEASLVAYRESLRKKQVDEVEKWKSAFEEMRAQNEQMKQEIEKLQKIDTHSKDQCFDHQTPEKRSDEFKCQELAASESLLRRDVEIYQARLEASERQLHQMDEKIEDQEIRHEREIKRLKGLLSDKLAELDDERSKIDLQIHKMQVNHEDEKRRLSDEKETVIKNLQDLVTCVRAERNAEEGKFLSRLRVLENELADKETLLEERDNELGHLRRSIQNTEEKMQDLQKDLNSSETEKVQLQSSVSNLRKDLVNLRDLNTRNQEKQQKELNQLFEKTKEQNEIIVAQGKESSDTARRLRETELKLKEAVKQKSLAEEKLANAMERVAHFEKELQTWPERESFIRRQEEERFEVKLGKEKTDYEASLIEARSEIAEIKQKCQSLESAKLFSQQEIDSLRRVNENLTERTTELRKNLDEADEQLSEQRMEILERDSELQDIREAMIRTQEELRSCKSSLDAAHLQYSDLSANFSQTNEAFANAKEEMNSRIVDLTEECFSLRSQKATMENKIRSIRRSASESEARCSRLRQELQHEREELLTQKRMTDQRIAKSREDLTIAEKKNSDLMEEVSVFKKDLSVLTAENNALQNEIKSLQRQCTQAEKMLRNSEAAHSNECRDLESNLETERAKFKSSCEALRLSNLEINSLQKELNYQKSLILEQQKKYEVDTEIMSQKQAELLSEKDSELERLRASAMEAGMLQRNLQQQEERLTSALSDLKQLESVTEKLRCELTQKSALAESRDAEVQKLRAELAETQAKLESEVVQLEALRYEVSERSKNLSALKIEREQLVAEKVKLANSLRKAEDDLSELNQELQLIRLDKTDLSTDSSNGDFSGLSKEELKKMCEGFQDDLRVLERRASDAIDDSARRQNQVERLVEDIGSLSTEIEKLVEANNKLNEYLFQVKSEKSDAIALKKTYEQKVESLEVEAEAIRDELESQRRMNLSLSESLENLRKQSQADRQKWIISDKQQGEQLLKLKQIISDSEQSNQSAEQEVERLSIEIMALEEEKELASVRTKEVERLLASKEVEYDEFKKGHDSMVRVLNEETSRQENRVVSLQNECEVLRRRVAELDMVEQSQRSQIQKLKEAEMTKDTSLAQFYEELEEKKRDYKAATSSLSEVQRISYDREKKIEQLEKQLAESEITISTLSGQLEKFQGTLKKIEVSAETSGNFRSQQMQEVETKCSLLEEERVSLTNEISILRDDLRKTRNDLHESQRLNQTLKNRHDNMKALMDSSKAELRQARESKEIAAVTAKKSETELESKQMELDHFRTQVQVMTATISRMKADYAMLQESAVQNELKAAASVQAQAEISNLKAELRKQKAKLNSLSAYQLPQPPIVPDLFEDQLLHFIEEVIREADSAFQDILRHSNIVCCSSSKRDFKSEELTALDLATPNSQQAKLEDVRDSMDSLSSIIPKAISYLNEKLELLQEWKRHRESRAEAKTPSRKFVRNMQDSSPILETLEKMKTVLTEDILSPCKRQTSDSNRPDPEMLQNVIISLEGQIDSLLSDLKAANEALRAKEQLFADLEDLVHHHETERDILERKLESMRSKITGEEIFTNATKRQGDASVENDEASTMPQHENTQTLAIQLACKVMNGDRHCKMALAFQHWSTFTATSRDFSAHSQAATALVHELETTREKLAILKKHLKKSRRGREPTLDRIIEGFVAN